MSLLVDERPPLELYGEITTPGGAAQRRWTGRRPNPEDRATAVRFRTARMTGFVDGSCVLRRRDDVDWPDLRLLSQFSLVGFDGRAAFEGRLGTRGASTGDAFTIQPSAVGWMAHAKDRRFTQVFIDRALGRWGDVPKQRQDALIGAGYGTQSPNVRADATGSGASLGTEIRGAWASKIACEPWYDAGPGNLIGNVRATWTKGANITLPDANWAWNVLIADNDAFTGGYDQTGNLSAAGPGTVDLNATTGRRYAFISFGYSAAGGGDNSIYDIQWTDLRVIGDHGLTIVGGTAATEGVLASDVVRWLVENYCPMLNASGVQDTDIPIPQLAFFDPTTPYDGFLKVNVPHLYGLEVWDNRTLHFAPVDASTPTWRVRSTDPGVNVQLQGASMEGRVSQLIVYYDDVSTGRREALLPADHSELVDDSAVNPFNAAGYPGEDSIALSTPTAADHALEVGAAALADRNRPIETGTVSVKGHARRNGGGWEPAYRMRAGDTVLVENRAGATPQLVVETDYDGDQHTVTLAVNSRFKRPDALLDELSGS